VGSKAEEAKALREYARSQGEVSRLLKSGEGVMFYRVEQRDGEQVRVACPPDELDPRERQRQINEAVRLCEKQRADANREANALERE
jgi:hypothetical protein